MEPIQLKDFLHYRALSALAWSPEGTRAAFLVHAADEEKNGYRNDLWLYEAESGELRQLTWAGDIRSFVWDGEDTITFTAAREETDRKLQAEGEPWTVFYTLPLDGGCATRSCAAPCSGALVGKLSSHVYVLQARVDLEKEARLKNLTGAERKKELEAIREERTRFSVFDEMPFWLNGAGVINKTRVGLFLYNRLTDCLSPITDPMFDVEGVSVVPEAGKIVYHGRNFQTLRDYRTGIWVYDHASGKTTCALEQGVYRMRQATWWKDQVVFAGSAMGEYNYSQTPALYVVPAEGGEPVPLAAPPMSIGNPVGSDVRYGGGCCFKTEGDRLYLISGHEDISRLLAVAPDGAVTVLAEPMGSVDLFDVKDGRILFVGMVDMGLQELYRLEDTGWSRLSTFHDAYLAAHTVAEPEPLCFTDPDGFEIHGFVLKPAGFDPARRYPAILDIHGGPRLSYGPVYYHEMQHWASRGYFVFYCNPRGSDSRGDEFALIRGKYGTVEYENIMQFTDEVLARYPQIDHQRLGVAGGSYGGFMTNWIIGHTSRFAAAASQRSISNFVSMEGTSDCGRVFLEGHIGATTAEDLEKVWSQSPLSAAHHCTTPTLFIHAEEDYRCWKVEALQMFTAIRAQGVDARLCLFKGENHELSRSGKPKSRIKRLEEITRWFDHYLDNPPQ